MSKRVRVVLNSNGIATVTMARPEKHNALDRTMFDGLLDAASQLSTEPTVGAVFLHGECGNFCSGLDIASFLSIGRY